MTSSFPNLQQFSHALHGSFLQVLCPEIEMTAQGNGGIHFKIRLDGTLQVITSGSQRQEIAQELDYQEGAAMEVACLELRNATSGTTEHLVFENFILRHASGGALPRFGATTSPTYMLFERDIAPTGWNIANGASSSRSELSHLDDLIEREAGEEIMFYDPARETVRVLAGSQSNREFELAKELWCEKLGSVEGEPVSWIAENGPDKITMEDRDGSLQTTDDLFVVLNAEDFGIECVRPIRLDGVESLLPLDGEILQGRLLDRRIGYFSDLEKACSGQPSQLFHSGQAIPIADNVTRDLCPVTAKVLDLMRS